MSTVKFQTSDKEICEIDLKLARVSGTIKNLLQDLGFSAENEDDDVIPLPTISSTNLKLVFEWAKYHKNDQVIAEDHLQDPKTDICKWDQEFLQKIDWSMMRGLIDAANYLDITGLLAVFCKNIANVLKEESLEDIRKIFKVTNDYTPEEEAQTRKKNVKYEKESSEFF